MTTLLRRLASFFRRDRLAADLDEEMRLHLDLRARKLAHQGVPDATFAARRQFGNTATLHEDSAGFWGWPSWERLSQDLRVAVRSLRKTPSFTVVAIATLAVGLGINTAVYSVVNAVMVRALPFPNADRLISLWEENTREKSQGRSGRDSVAVANLPDYRSLPAFVSVAAYNVSPMNLTGIGSPERITGENVTAEYLATLGVSPAIGRDFTRDDQAAGADSVILLSHDFWQRRMGGDPAALGRTIQLDGQPRRIVGIMPAGFRSPAQLRMAAKVEFWIAAQYRPDLLTNRGDHEVAAFALLKPGVSLTAARSQLDALNASLAKAYPETNANNAAAIAPLQGDLTRNLGDSLTALLGASALIVLIACVNVANLFLIRSVGRRHEVAVRLAIGANRWRVIRQFLTESFVIAAAGCLAGIALGFTLMKALVSLAPENMPMIRTVAWDWRVFAIATVVATVTGALFGLAPAWQASRTRPAESMRNSSRVTVGGAQARWRWIFAVVEVALSLILLVGAGLLLKSFIVLMGVDLGFQPERVLALNISLPGARYSNQPQRFRFFQQLEERVRVLPGVESVAYANRLPLRGGWGSTVQLDSDAPGAPMRDVGFQTVSPGYFATLGVPLLRGRALTPQDREGQPPVAVVNQTFASRHFAGANPIGRRARRYGAPWFEIVGVVNDIRRGGKTAEITPQVYLSSAQTGMYPVQLADLAVRTATDPRALVNAIQAEVWAIDKEQPVSSVLTLEEILTASVAQRRFQMLLLIVFASVAVALAVIGIYGVLSYSVTQRTSELGIRIALGARPGAIHALVLRQAGLVIAAGITAGLAGAWAVTVYLESLLFQVKAHDWRTYAAAATLLAVVAVGAALLPARRGARIDPMVALKYE
jgi:putative ABC transport system permease protein